MKREILTVMSGHNVCGCCPVHDKFPNGVFKSRRSVKARAKGKQTEHQVARAIAKRNLIGELSAI